MRNIEEKLRPNTSGGMSFHGTPRSDTKAHRFQPGPGLRGHHEHDDGRGRGPGEGRRGDPAAGPARPRRAARAEQVQGQHDQRRAERAPGRRSASSTWSGSPAAPRATGRRSVTSRPATARSTVVRPAAGEPLPDDADDRDDGQEHRHPPAQRALQVAVGQQQVPALGLRRPGQRAREHAADPVRLERRRPGSGRRTPGAGPCRPLPRRPTVRAVRPDRRGAGQAQDRDRGGEERARRRPRRWASPPASRRPPRAPAARA